MVDNLKELNDYSVHTCGCLSTGKIEQCILFGFNLLEDLFDNDIKTVKEFLEDKDKFFKSSKYKYEGPRGQIYLLRNILKILILFVNQNIDKIIEFSINKYNLKIFFPKKIKVNFMSAQCLILLHLILMMN